MHARSATAPTHPDLHGPEEAPALTYAGMGGHVFLMERLIAHGASAAVMPYWNEHPGEWPTTWSNAHMDAFMLGKEPYQQVWRCLLRHRSSPLETIEDEQRGSIEEGAITPRSDQASGCG